MAKGTRTTGNRFGPIVINFRSDRGASFANKAATVVAAEEQDLGAGGGGRKYRKGTGNYVVLRHKGKTVVKLEKPVLTLASKPEPVRLSAEDFELRERLLAAQIRQDILEIKAEQEAIAAGQSEKIVQLDRDMAAAELQQQLLEEEEALLLLLLAA